MQGRAVVLPDPRAHPEPCVPKVEPLFLDDLLEQVPPLSVAERLAQALEARLRVQASPRDQEEEPKPRQHLQEPQARDPKPRPDQLQQFQAEPKENF